MFSMDACRRRSTRVVAMAILVVAFSSAVPPRPAAAAPCNQNICVPPDPNTPPQPNQNDPLQAIVARTPPGGIAQLPPGHFETNLVLTEANLMLRGSPQPNPTILTAADASHPVVSILGRSAVQIGQLTIVGGNAGIRGFEGSASRFGPPRVPIVNAFDLDLVGNGRGVSGQFAALRVADSTIRGSVVNGMSILRAPATSLVRLNIFDSGGNGVVILDPGNNATVFAQNLYLHDNRAAGLYARRVGGGVVLIHIEATRNGGAGIAIEDSGQSYVERSIMSFTHSVGGNFGEGLVVFSTTVQVSGSRLRANEPFEAALVGCDGPPINKPVSVTFMNDEFVPTDPVDATMAALYPLHLCPDGVPPGSVSFPGTTCSSKNCKGMQTVGDSVSPIPITP